MSVVSCRRPSCSLSMPYSGWFFFSCCLSSKFCQSAVGLRCLCTSFYSLSVGEVWCLSLPDSCTAFHWWCLSAASTLLVGRWLACNYVLHFLYSYLFGLVLFSLWSSILVIYDCWYNSGVVLPFFDVVLLRSWASNHVLHQDPVISSWGSSSVGSLLCWLLFQGISLLFFNFIFLWSPEAMLPVYYRLLGYCIYPPMVSWGFSFRVFLLGILTS